jgi:hypothetical protein
MRSLSLSPRCAASAPPPSLTPLHPHRQTRPDQITFDQVVGEAKWGKIYILWGEHDREGR